MPRSQWSDDAGARPLSDAGVAAMARETWILARLGLEPDLILTSPQECAQQTAGIVASGLGLEDRVRTEPGLGPAFGMKKLRRLLRTHAHAGSIMLVDRDPQLSAVIRKLTGGHMVLSKGGLAHVHLAARKSASAELVCLLQAGKLAALVRNSAAASDTAASGEAGVEHDPAG